MKLNLSRRIALFVGIIIIAISFGLGTRSMMTGGQAMRKQGNIALEDLAQEGANHIESVINGELNVLYELASRRSVKTMDYQTQKEDLARSIDRLGYKDIGIARLDGQVEYIKSGISLNISDRNYFKGALQGELVISDILVDQVSDELLFVYAAPITRNDEVIGVLLAQKDATFLTNTTNNMGFGENGYAFIIDNTGVVYAHPDTQLIIDQKNIMEDLETNGQYKEVALALQELGLGNAGYMTYQLDGSTRMMGVAPVSSRDWILGIGAYESEVLGGIRVMQTEIFWAAIITLVLGIMAALLLGRSIASPITALAQILERFSNYDISVDENSKSTAYMKRKDEIGHMANSLRQMQKNLIDLISSIAAASQDVAASSEELTATSEQSASASTELASAIEDIANGASAQASDTETGATNIEELGREVEATQQIIENLYKSSEEIDSIKDAGLEVVKELVEKTAQNNQSAKEIYDVIISADQSAEQINSASLMIKAISDQTNLLALNAAIEAARAGDAGRGFAVVADEIKKLAEQSNDFAGEIERVVDELLVKTHGSVEVMERVNQTTQEQTQSVSLTTDAFEAIAQKLQEINDLVSQADHSGNTMAAKKDQIVAIIQNLSAVAQQNAAGTEEASASVEEQTASVLEISGASESLSELANKMQELVGRFNY